ncbi:MAG: 50S ribosomal protein L12 [Hamadaea sp.]|nr:50S ribosomal protein L12 [Hamadaea sp.]
MPTIALLLGVAIVAFLLGRASKSRRPDDLVSGQLAARSPNVVSSPSAGRPPAPEVVAQAAQLKSRGQIIHAVKLVREQTGLSLKEAKDIVDRL